MPPSVSRLAARLLGGAAILLALGAAAAPVRYYVATDGDDTWDGRQAFADRAAGKGPFSTLDRAREAARLTPDASVEIVVREGVYDLGETLRLAPEDGGSETRSVVWRAYPDERVVLRGGRRVIGWQPEGDGVYRADLAAQGLADARFHQLFLDDERQVLARHPNVDPDHPRTGGFKYLVDPGPEPRSQFYYAAGDLPFDRWGDIGQAEIVLVLGGGWNFGITPIHDVDTSRRLITTRPVRRLYVRHNRFFVQNARALLDAPGEWFFDRKTSILYFRPPEDEAEKARRTKGRSLDGRVVVPTLDNIVEIAGSIPYPHQYLKVGFKGGRGDARLPDDAPPFKPVQYVTFQGFEFGVSRHSAISLTGARRCAVIGCRVKNVGNMGVNLGNVANAELEVGNPRVADWPGFSGGVAGGGQNLLFNDPCVECRVMGCDVRAVGADGVFLYGTANVAENNHVYHIGLFDKDCGGVSVWGEQNVARRNTIHDVPRNAIFLKGVDNIVEFNHLFRTMLETCDGGAIRMCQRNLALRGNVIRHNAIIDTLGYGMCTVSRRYKWPYYCWGVYLDDYTGGTTVEGNLIVRTAKGGVMLHGGDGNLVRNNLLLDTGECGVQFSSIKRGLFKDARVEGNIIQGTYADFYLYGIGDVEEGFARFERNLVWAPRGDVTVRWAGKDAGLDWDEWLSLGLETDSRRADPRLREVEDGFYFPDGESPAWQMGFPRLPLRSAGCYEGEARATWPLAPDVDLQRETPFAWRGPSLPVRVDYEDGRVGKPPIQGGVNSQEGGASRIRLTDETAGQGARSLMILDAPGLSKKWKPRLFYPCSYEEGLVVFQARFRLDGERRPTIGVDFRQYTDTGAREFFSGPSFRITPEGNLEGPGMVIDDLPFDDWFQVEIRIPLGNRSDAPCETIIRREGRGERRVRGARRDAEFSKLERVVITSDAETTTLFHLDDVVIEPITD